MIAEMDKQVVEVTTKSAITTVKALWALLSTIAQNRNRVVHGEQSVRKLNLQGRKLESVPLQGEDIGALRRELRRYSVDFSVMQNKDAGTYTVFFKAQDVDRVHYACEQVVKAHFQGKGEKSFAQTAEEARHKAAAANQSRESFRERDRAPKEREARA